MFSAITFSRVLAPRRLARALVALCTVSALFTVSAFCRADNAAPYPGTVVLDSRYSFDAVQKRLESAVAKHGMGLVAQASASRGAAARGIKIPGNVVLMVFRNDYAVRMLKASIPAGIEAPLRFYVTENADGTANVTYRKPSAVFAPYGSAALDVLAAELDPIFAQIAEYAGGE